MRPSLRRLAVAGCTLELLAATSPTSAMGAPRPFQVIDNTAYGNIHQTVTHQPNRADRKNAEEIIHPRTEILEISMTDSTADKRFNERSTQLAMQVVDGVTTEFSAQRGACITGLVGQQFEESHKDRKFDLGKVCVALAEKSAEFQLDPAKLKADPDKAILGAYKEVLYQNQMKSTFAQAQRLLNSFNEFASNPDTKGSSGLGFQWSDQPNAQPLQALPSGSIDAGFSQAVQDFQKSGVLPPEPKAKDDALLENARVCYLNQGTLGACHATGKALGAKYLRKVSRVS